MQIVNSKFSEREGRKDASRTEQGRAGQHTHKERVKVVVQKYPERPGQRGDERNKCCVGPEEQTRKKKRNKKQRTEGMFEVLKKEE